VKSGESIRSILRFEIIFYILELAYKTTDNRVSFISSSRMKISKLNRISDSDNMGFVEIEHLDVGLSTS
jgi:hypothetical protein